MDWSPVFGKMLFLKILMEKELLIKKYPKNYILKIQWQVGIGRFCES